MYLSYLKLFLSYAEFIDAFPDVCSFREFSIVPLWYYYALKRFLSFSSCCSIYWPYCICLSVSCVSLAKVWKIQMSDHFFFFLQLFASSPHNLSYWNNMVDNLHCKKIWSLRYKYLLTNKMREISFKIMHKYYPVK